MKVKIKLVFFVDGILFFFFKEGSVPKMGLRHITQRPKSHMLYPLRQSGFLIFTCETQLATENH